MTGIVLSASVRQNLLSLQSTATLLATTQNDLATGNKVNSALDNPTSFFTAAALNNRASDISNLLDSIGNGVQVLQAANTGITSLQSLVASAQSVANQVLQTPVGYSTKSSVSTTAISGATANNLLGTGAGYTDATFAGATSTGTITAAFTSATSTGTSVSNDNSTPAAISTSTQLVGTASSTSNDLAAGAITDGSTLVVDGKTITFSTGTTTASSGSSSTGFTIGIGTGSTATIQTILTDIDAITGGSGSTVVGGKLEIATGTTANLTITGTGNALTGLGLGTGVTLARSGGATSTTALTGSTLLSGTTSSSVGSLTNGFSVGDTLVVDGKTLTFVSGTAGANQISTTGTVANLLAAIDTASGNTGTASSISGGVITLHTGTINGTLSISSSNATALTALGLSGGVTQAATGASPSLSGETLLIAATGGGTASSITFGTGAGQVSSLNQLNAALAANNLQATIDPAGIITLTTSNNAASSTIGAITGTSTAAGQAFNGLVAVAPVADPNAQATRAGLIAQYNNILKQIDTTSQELLVQRHQPARGRYAEPDLRRNRQVYAGDPGRHLQYRGPRPDDPRFRYRFPGFQFSEYGADLPWSDQHHAAFGSLEPRFEFVDRADPSGLLQEPDQRAADRRLEPDAGRHQRGSGQQPGAVDPPVDRGLRAGARQPVAAERASAAPLIPALQKKEWPDLQSGHSRYQQ